jgi:saccharopine dehydrogenase-like NADP-dependent oxidoreductase
MSRPEPIVAVVGVGVTGTRVATNLAGIEGLRIGVVDQRNDVAVVTARSIGGAAIDVEEAQFADVAVLALPAPHATLARRFLSNGVAVVSMSDDVDDVEELLSLTDLAGDNDLVLVVGAAMAPGLSGLLARLLADKLGSVDEIHVAMHGTGGPACARQHHRSLGGTSIGLHDGEWIKRPAGAGRELCWFPEPVNSYDCYRAEMPDPILLNRVFPGVERMTARISATRRDRFTSRLPMLRPPHKEGGVGGVRVEVRGGLVTGERETLVAGTSVRSGIAAAAVASAMAQWAITVTEITGIVVLGDPRLPTADLLEQISASGVPLSEFTGRARSADG